MMWVQVKEGKGEEEEVGEGEKNCELGHRRLSLMAGLSLRESRM
jgi:hypothetical protein